MLLGYELRGTGIGWVPSSAGVVAALLLIQRLRHAQLGIRRANQATVVGQQMSARDVIAGILINHSISHLAGLKTPSALDARCDTHPRSAVEAQSGGLEYFTFHVSRGVSLVLRLQSDQS